MFNVNSSDFRMYSFFFLKKGLFLLKIQILKSSQLKGSLVSSLMLLLKIRYNPEKTG